MLEQILQSINPILSDSFPSEANFNEVKKDYETVLKDSVFSATLKYTQHRIDFCYRYGTSIWQTLL